MKNQLLKPSNILYTLNTSFVSNKRNHKYFIALLSAPLPQNGKDDVRKTIMCQITTNQFYMV